MPSLWMLASVPFPFLIPFCFRSHLLHFVFRIAFRSRRCHQRQTEGRPSTTTDPSRDAQTRPMLHVGSITFGHRCISVPLHLGLVSLRCGHISSPLHSGAVTFRCRCIWPLHLDPVTFGAVTPRCGYTSPQSHAVPIWTLLHFGVDKRPQVA